MSWPSWYSVLLQLSHSHHAVPGKFPHLLPLTLSLDIQIILAVLAATATAAPQIVPYVHEEIPAVPYVHEAGMKYLIWSPGRVWI